MANAHPIAHSAALREIARYAIVGVLTLCVFAITNWLLVRLGFRAEISAGIAVLISGIFNYIGHANFTFESSEINIASIAKFILITTCNSMAMAILVSFLQNHFGLFASNAISLICVTLGTFLMLKYFAMPARQVSRL